MKKKNQYQLLITAWIKQSSPITKSYWRLILSRCLKISWDVSTLPLSALRVQGDHELFLAVILGWKVGVRAGEQGVDLALRREGVSRTSYWAAAEERTGAHRHRSVEGHASTATVPSPPSWDFDGLVKHPQVSSPLGVRTCWEAGNSWVKPRDMWGCLKRAGQVLRRSLL